MQVYKEALAHPQTSVVHLTLVERDFECDTHFPELSPTEFRLWSSSTPCTAEDGTR
jgi:dihydrofolate reductase